MKKADIKSFSQLASYAAMRAAASLKRNDPWAMTYWKKTEEFARDMSRALLPSRISDWLAWIKECLQYVNIDMNRCDLVSAALWYSRAKWHVILARNNGFVMNPRVTGVSPKVFLKEGA